MNKIIVLVLLSTFTISLYGQKPFYGPNGKDTVLQEHLSNLQHSIYLVGDIGDILSEKAQNNFKLLKEKVSETPNSTVVFLGDNIYPKGLPEKDDKIYDEAKSILDKQLTLKEHFKGKMVYVPGNHDWNKWSAEGNKAVKRQEKYIEKRGKKYIHAPSNACAGPEVVKISKDIVVITIDSQWWLHNWSKEDQFNKDCDVKSRNDFIRELSHTIDKYANKHVVLAMHHPVYSNGEHGGYFNWKHHIFPLTQLNKKLWIPLPILGSISPILRSIGINKQDIPHPLYQDFREAIFESLIRKKNVIIASGHDHNLQYFYRDNNHFVISGSGSKENPLQKNSDVDFAYDQVGFSRVDIYDNEEVWLSFFSPSTNNENKLLFRKCIKAPLQFNLDSLNTSNKEQKKVSKSATQEYEIGKLGRKLWGEHYRAAWKTPIEVDQLILGGEYTPIKIGGGQQSTSLRLKRKNGKQYALRSINKSVKKIIPQQFANSAIHSLFQDQISMAHPYAALTIPGLAKAAGIYYSTPDIVYLPQQPALGTYNERFGNQLFLLEERPAGDWSDEPAFGNSKDIVSFRKVIWNTQKNQHHRVDQKHVLKSRLFDIWVGDWDRHDDQWRWASFKDKNNNTFYRPIPRDRDQVFVSFDGFFPNIINSRFAARQIQHFDYKLKDVAGLCYNAKFFDRAFLTEQTKEDWIAMAEQLQTQLSDETIETSFNRWPKQFHELDAQETIAKLKQRKKDLPYYAEKYYDFLSRSVTVVGTNKKEAFEVKRFDKESMSVTMYPVHKGAITKSDTLFHRVFKKSETKEVRLFGLDDNDIFSITGSSKKSPLLRIIGGDGNDKFSDSSKVSGMGKKTLVYDIQTGGSISVKGPELRDKRGTDPELNAYKRTVTIEEQNPSFSYNTFIPLALGGYNVDDGFSLSGGFIDTRHGFRKYPYKSKQTLLAKYAFATQGFDIRYRSNFTDVIKKIDLNLHINAHSPKRVQNFFGLGNETVNTEEIDFYRVRREAYQLTPYLRFSRNNTINLSIGPSIEYTRIENTPNRILNLSDPSNIQRTFDKKYFAGIQSNFSIEKITGKFFPTKGTVLKIDQGWTNNLTNGKDFYAIDYKVAVYTALDRLRNVVFANQIGGGHRFGEHEFFQASRIGGRENLRGYRAERFSGDHTFFLNNDLRIKVTHLKNKLIPMTLGIIGFYDMARVWQKNEQSTIWHSGYGGGIWIAPLNITTINLTVDLSPENTLFSVKFGFQF